MATISQVLPDLDPVTGELPPGRYLTDLDAIHERFVAHDQFASSVNRPIVWAGFTAYRKAWDVAEGELGEQVILAWWIGGSFASSSLEPGDIDVTPVLDGDRLSQLSGASGMGKVKQLIQHRDGVRDEFHVEPYQLRWSAQPCTLFPDGLSPVVQAMLAKRGGLDAWWSRVRPEGPKGAALKPRSFAERGYLEVLR